MTIRHSLLALLAQEPAHGYALKAGFEATTGGTWPLNVGQVYTTLARLERDGLAEGGELGAGERSSGDRGPAEGGAGRRTWRITEAGRAALEAWYAEPVSVDPPPRDELALKVLLAIAADAEDVSAILQRQREAIMEGRQRYACLKRRAGPERGLPWLLLVDALVLKFEAEIRWLDLCEERVRARDGRG